MCYEASKLKSGSAAVLAALLLSATSIAAGDTLELTNGDTLTGTVVEQTDAGVVFEHPALGRIEIETERVAAVTITPPADAPPPEPEVEPEPEPAPEPAPAPAPAADPVAAEEDAQQAAELEELDQRSMLQVFIDEWAGKLTLGFNGASGNTDNLNFYARIEGKKQEGNDRWIFNASWNYGTTRSVTNRNQFTGMFTRDWLKNDDSRWFYFIRGEYNFDRFRGYESRASGFGGTGYTIFRTDDVEINTRMGFGGTYEFGDVHEFTPEALFGGSVLSWQRTDRAAISGAAIWYTSLEDADKFRITSRLEWVYKLDVHSGLSLKLGVQSEYLSQSVGDRDHNDMRYYGALEIKF